MRKSKVNLSDEDILDGLKKCIRSFLIENDKKIKEINLSDDFENDLGFDSIDETELLVDIEKKFSVRMGYDFEPSKTVDDIFLRLKTALK